MTYSLEQWQHDLKEQESCRHSILGACSIPCTECGVYGFMGVLETGQRKYKLCKWCCKGQDVGGEVFQCFVEACSECFPDKDLQEALVLSDAEKKNKLTVHNTDGNYEEGIRITMSPGHRCPKHGTVMRTSALVDKWHYASMEVLKDEIYEIHQY